MTQQRPRPGCEWIRHRAIALGAAAKSEDALAAAERADAKALSYHPEPPTDAAQSMAAMELIAQAAEARAAKFRSAEAEAWAEWEASRCGKLALLAVSQ